MRSKDHPRPGRPARAPLALATPLLALLATACPGSSGELGEEHFVYRCAADSDPYCDAELFDQYCYGTCERPFDGNLDEKVPGTIALGSRFLVLADPGGFSAITPTPVSPSIVERDGDAFRAVALGEVALLAFEGGVAQDYLYIEVVAPAGLRVDYIDDLGARETNVTAVTVATGDRGWLRAVPVDEYGEYLYGAFPCAWSAADDDAIDFDTDPMDNLVRVSMDATETVTLPVSVSLGELEATVAITVLDASDLERGAR